MGPRSLYYSAECEFVRSCIPASQKNVNGDVRLKVSVPEQPGGAAEN
jgi:hypothetical protein